MDISTVYDTTSKQYIARTDKVLPYGTYEIIEEVPSTGYQNSGWRQTFQIRNDQEMISYTSKDNWNENEIARYGVVIGKRDRETNEYTSLGNSTLNGAVFEIKNISNDSVYVDGNWYKPNEIVGTLSTTEEFDEQGNLTYVARSKNNWLPYGTYEVKEIQTSHHGYLFDELSKAYTRQFSVGYNAFPTTYSIGK